MYHPWHGHVAQYVYFETSYFFYHYRYINSFQMTDGERSLLNLYESVASLA